MDSAVESLQQTPPTQPDWDTTNEIHCPLCEYNLRGLVEPRCPECGFTFDWHELLSAERDRHPYLFEHQPKRNTWSFWKTFWRDCCPRRFWRELNPAQPINRRRLLIYWFLANIFVLLAFPYLMIEPAIRIAQTNTRYRAMWVPVGDGTSYQLAGPYASTFSPPIVPAAWLDSRAPHTWSVAFLRQVWTSTRWDLSPMPSLLVVLSWTWLTLAAMAIFQASLRRAKVRNAHLLRCAIYCCDFPLLAAVTTLLLMWDNWAGPHAQVTIAALLCPWPALYRLTFAYRRYLRFDHTFLTALTTQVIVGLTVFIIGLNLARWYW